MVIEHKQYNTPASTVPVGIFITPEKRVRQGFYIFPKGEFDCGIGLTEIKESDIIIGSMEARKIEYINPKTQQLKMIEIKFKYLDHFRIELHPSSDCKLDVLNKMLSTVEFL